MKKIKGYENKEIELYSYDEINKAVKGDNDKEVFKMLKETGNLLHYQDDKKKIFKELNLNHYGKLCVKLKEEVKKRLGLKGYNFDSNEPNWFNDYCLSIDDTNKREKSIQFEEILEKGFENNNTLKYFHRLIDDTSELNEGTTEEVLSNILDLKAEQLKTFLQFIKEKDINVENIQSIEIENDSFIEIELFNRSYWLLTDEEGERRARTYLEDDDELWKMAVESGNTTSGFDDWIEDVLNMDGWESVLNGYNGMSNGLFGDWYYMRMN